MRFAMVALALSLGVGGAPDSASVDAIFAEWDRPDSPGCALGASRTAS